jgi:hypothetical protein
METKKWGMVIGVHALANPEYRDLLRDAEVIFAHDVSTGSNSIVFGRDVLQRIAGSDAGGEAKVLTVELDQGTDELEYLVTVVELVKGQHDYKPSSGSPPA